jgi:hypothetical protein
MVPEGEFAAGEQQRILSQDPNDGALSAIVQFRNPLRGRLTSGADVFLLEGAGTLNGEGIGRSDYVRIPAGASVEWRPNGHTVIFLGSFGTPRLEAVDGEDPSALVITHSESVPWVPAGWADTGALEPGAAMKWLNRDGPALVLLAGMLPGWKSQAVESHPIYEESFKLTGDNLMGRRGVMQSGAYFYRGPDIEHGPLYTRTGTMSLIRWSAPATSVFSEPLPDGTWDSLAATAYAAPLPAARSY